jgi:L-aminopeptidase/D-esterase-like protein
LGITIGTGRAGPGNAITDVAGVSVGHATLVRGEDVRTGVTVLFPCVEDPDAEPVFAGCHRLNGNGELTGLEWIRESGLLTSPVALTNTHCDRLAQRAGLGVARTGGAGENSSGDLFLAFATGNRGLAGGRLTLPLEMLAGDRIDPLFYAVIEATEEAIVNAMVAAETMTGRGGATAHRLDHDRLREGMGRYRPARVAKVLGMASPLR